ncbi:hypothetical protein [Halosimplex pelagicum]|uniref:Uncharacterized protein n=1 Tax=Halosimplex pelagicum TaxID=869886 RepID=A0A7D5SWU7_9EURY|nr:hypothetical protein [Halosimplex pelagicum]QLH83347.1 hypothetical protein HZS54_17670 [Halosimplex pelagicum]
MNRWDIKREFEGGDRDEVDSGLLEGIDWVRDAEHLWIRLTNYGPGIAKNLRIDWELLFGVYGEDGDEMQYMHPDPGLDLSTHPIINDNRDIRTLFSRETGDLLPPDHEPHDFISPLMIGNEEDPSQYAQEIIPLRVVFRAHQEGSIHSDEYEIQTISLTGDLYYDTTVEEDQCIEEIIRIESEIKDRTLSEIVDDQGSAPHWK